MTPKEKILYEKVDTLTKETHTLKVLRESEIQINSSLKERDKSLEKVIELLRKTIDDLLNENVSLRTKIDKLISDQ
jgi:ApbE superfamily uncharacterized protein (UPF0280 family)|tara:strand:+ start:2162 stop:2389 length:228 start_codon:yes stop_codon:yes gene_type:complete